MIRLIRRPSPAELADVEHLVSHQQRLLLDRARALVDEAEGTIAAAQREAERIRRHAAAEARDAAVVAQAEGARVIKDADIHAARSRRDVEAEAADRVSRAEAEAARIRAEALAAAAGFVEEGQRRLDEAITEVRRLLNAAERLRAQLPTGSRRPETPAAAAEPAVDGSSQVQVVNPHRAQVLAALTSLERAISAQPRRRGWAEPRPASTAVRS